MPIRQPQPYDPAPTPLTSSVLDGYLKHQLSITVCTPGRTPFILLPSPLMLDHPTGWPGTYIDCVSQFLMQEVNQMSILFIVVGASVNTHQAGGPLGTKGRQRCIWCPRRSGGKAGALEESLSFTN